MLVGPDLSPGCWKSLVRSPRSTWPATRTFLLLRTVRPSAARLLGRPGPEPAGRLVRGCGGGRRREKRWPRGGGEGGFHDSGLGPLPNPAATDENDSPGLLTVNYVRRLNNFVLLMGYTT
jgi:hypothetical protein